VVGLAWLEDVHDRAPGARRTLAVAVASVVAACLTPSGPAVWSYAVGLSVNPLITGRITEWAPTSLRDIPGMLFFGSVLLVVVLIARRGRQTAWSTLLWLGVFVAIGVYAIRGVAWWPLAAVAAIAGTLLTEPAPRPDRPPRTDPPLMRGLNVVVAGAIVAVCVALLPVWRPLDPDLQAPSGVVGHAPPGITAVLRETGRPGDHVLNPQTWGSWFEFELPDLLVAVDSRIEIFPLEVWQDIDGVTAGVEGWQQTLDDWGVSIVVAASPKQDPMAARLVANGWREIHRDTDGAVLVRADRAAS
jgi:hypothetical protein